MTSPAVAPARQLTDTELDAWRTFLRAHARVTRQLDAELEAETGLALTSYEVLLYLRQRPDRRMRMTELADRVLLSRSGLTRLVDRLERDGLLRREACPSDARGTFATLTDEGAARFAEAAPVHLRGVREHFTSQLGEAERVLLAELLGRVAGAPSPDDPACGND